MAVGRVRSTSFGRKRIALSNIGVEYEISGCIMPTTPSKRHRVEKDTFFSGEKSELENLPQEILIKILCGVEHDDLERLLCVSIAVREATLIAKQHHFAYNTPKKIVGFQDVGYFGNLNEAEAPNAPKQCRFPRRRLSVEKLDDISIALFASCDEDPEIYV